MFKYRFGNQGDLEGRSIYLILEKLSERFGYLKILEVGTQLGLTSRTLFQIEKDLSKKYEFYGIDIDLPKNPYLENMRFIQGDANDEKILEQLPDDLNFILLDACHCYDCTKNGFNLYSRKLSKGGIFAFHDTSMLNQGRSEPCLLPHKSKVLKREVLKAIQDLNLKEMGFELILEAAQFQCQGIRFYEKKLVKE